MRLTPAQRVSVAISGILFALKSEPSFRFQVVAGIGASLFFGLTGASPLWWGCLLSMMGIIFAAELLNTALEQALDLVHPGMHPAIKIAKDCAAGAVLVPSLFSLALFAVYVSQLIRP